MSDKSGYTKKESDWLGQEKEVHYNSEGQKVGETKFTEDWLGRSKQEHYNLDGDKTGETRKGSDWLGRERAEHYGSHGEKSGYSQNEQDWLGHSVQRHYDTRGEKVGDTRREEDWLGRSRKEHRGTYYKSGSSGNDSNKSATDTEHSSSLSSISAGSHNSSPPLGTTLGIILIGGGVLFGGIVLLGVIKNLGLTKTRKYIPPSISIEFRSDRKPNILPERVYCSDSRPVMLTVPNKYYSIKLRKDCWTEGVDDPKRGIGNGFFESHSNKKGTYIVQCSNGKELTECSYMQAYQYLDCTPPMYFKAENKPLILSIRVWKLGTFFDQK